MKQITVDDILEIIKDLHLDVDADKLDPKVYLPSQGVDSLDLANLLFGIEDKTSVKIPDEVGENEDLLTLEKLAEYVNGLIK